MSNTKQTNINFEASMRRLDEISAMLEKESVSLEEALTLYEEGVKLVRVCNERLEEAQRKIKLLQISEDGEMIEKDFFTDTKSE